MLVEVCLSQDRERFLGLGSLKVCQQVRHPSKTAFNIFVEYNFNIILLRHLFFFC